MAKKRAAASRRSLNIFEHLPIKILDLEPLLVSIDKALKVIDREETAEVKELKKQFRTFDGGCHRAKVVFFKKPRKAARTRTR
jgi:hypothetical protein